ncbi:MAG: TonB-dependent hemoglobin/transferrin/lactoferrin family receptor [Rhodovibrionaceae bacterium]
MAQGFTAAILAVATLATFVAGAAAEEEHEVRAAAKEQVAATQDAEGSVSLVAANSLEGAATMNTISITATRTSTEAFEFPGMVTVMGRDRIDTLQPSSPDDILRFVPGVTFTGGPRRTGEVPSIRGFSGQDVIVMVDGVRRNFESGHDGRFFIDPSLIKEVEVLRGPSSALYGSGGLGGVIELRTIDAADLLEPGETWGARIGGGFQSANDEWHSGLTLFGADGPFDAVASITYRDGEDIRLGDGSDLIADDDILSGLVKGTWTPDENQSISLSYSRYHDDAVEPNNGQGGTTALDGLVDKEIIDQTVQAEYTYYDPDMPWLDARAIVYYTQTAVDEEVLDGNGASPQGAKLERDLRTYGISLQNSSHVDLGESLNSTFTYGVDYYRDDQKGRDSSNAPSYDRNGVPTAEADSLGLFFQAELDFIDLGPIPGAFTLIPGVRFDYYRVESAIAETAKYDEVSPKIAASYRPMPWMMVFGSYGKAFRAPTFNEAYASGTHFVIPGFGVNNFVANPDLKPQTTRTLEFGLGFDFEDVLIDDDSFTIKASHYETWGKDFIDLEVVQPGPPACFPPACNGTTQAINVADARLWGNEVEAVYDNRRFRLSFGYADIDGEDKDTGEPLGVLFPTTVTLDGAVKFPEFDSLVGLRGIFAGHFDNTSDPAEERQSYETYDIYAAWAPSDGPLQGLRVDLGVDNVFDEEYSRVYTGALEQGRNWKAAVSYTLAY